jgi:hypothetical protein
VAVEDTNIAVLRDTLAALQALPKTKVGRPKLNRPRCRVIGCPIVKQGLSKYCPRHTCSWRKGMIEDNKPIYIREKVKLAFLFAREKVQELRKRVRPDAEIKDEFFRDMTHLLAATSDEEIAENSAAKHEEMFDSPEAANDPRYVTYKREFRKRRQRLKDFRMSLHDYPIDFQISRVLDEGDVLTLHIGVKVNGKVDDKVGYQADSQFVVEKDYLLYACRRAFDKGTPISLYLGRDGIA